MLIGLSVAVWATRKRKLSSDVMLNMAFWIILASLIGSRLIYVLSEYQYYLSTPQAIVKIWEGGLSISGGFMGALFAAWLYIRYYRLPFLPYADVAVFGLPVGLWIGRLGCFFIYDHPGTSTSFFLGQMYVDGVVRHNHGLYLSLQGAVIAIVFFLLWKLKPSRISGIYCSLFLVLYGSTRFVLDFWRASDLPFADARFLSLTVAQYVSVGMVVIGCLLWYSIHHSNNYFHATNKKKNNSA
ncbi:MAG TPA: prolipoprotein diacylglyceryl transferase family protein, partial [Patescibacteria group bacterium]|nr:prolipoprotein diacylglyceryl transferase family protein [Patescibacteria group bacterium]